MLPMLVANQLLEEYMCGVSGIYERGGKAVDRSMLLAMRDRLVHRGPDDSGEHVSDHIGLSLNRLAVIDLSPKAHQPMANEDSTIVVAFNGEIYNFRSLRPQLEERGHRFRSASDTEVILRGYEEWGTEILPRLNGMFGLAIWDSRSEQLILARDRLGKKPLFYLDQGGRVVFASELGALLAGLESTPALDPAALDAYLAYLCVPGERSIFKGVRKVPPAHYAVFHRGGATLTRYWDLSFRRKTAEREPALLEELDELLQEATRIRLISDVPLGAFLSGGVDSSAIVAHMSRLMPEPRTFSIGFADEDHNELPHARAVARALGTRHEEFVVEPDAAEILPRLVWHYGEPFADSSAIPTYYVAQMARRHVTVALNGDGGDEIFAGYPWCLRERMLQRYREGLPEWLRAGPLRSLGKSIGRISGRAAYLAAALLVRGGSPAGQTFWIWPRWGREEQQALYDPAWLARLDGDSPQEHLLDLFKRSSATQDLDRTLDVAIRSYLPDDLLVKVDIASMANSLETRSPLLDHRVVEFAAALPTHLKVRGSVTKYLLKKHTARLLPSASVHRRKQGFAVPLARWLRGPLRPFLESILLHPRALRRGYFAPDSVRLLVRRFLQGEPLETRVWSLLWLELWSLLFLDKQIDAGTTLKDFM